MSTWLEGPASGLSGMLQQSGTTGGMGMEYLISAPTMSTGEIHSTTFASTSSSYSSTSSASNAMDAVQSEGATQPLQQAITEIFGDRCLSSVFNNHLNQGDLEQTMREYEPISASPFIPSSPHPHSRSRSWMSDALDEKAYFVEMFLIPALKATLLAARNAVGETSEHLEDSIMFITAALQAARHMRKQAKFGFAEERSLKEDTVDPLLTPEQLERLKPILQANSSKLQSARQGRLAQRPRRQRAQNFSTKKAGYEEQRKHFFGENRGQDTSLCQRVEEDRRLQLGGEWSSPGLEGEESERQADTRERHGQRLYRWSEREEGMCGMDCGRLKNRHFYKCSEERGSAA